MHVYSLPPDRVKRRLVWETWVDLNTVIVTSIEDGTYETSVIGGPMDGMDCDTCIRKSARKNHIGMVDLARSCSS